MPAWRFGHAMARLAAWSSSSRPDGWWERTLTLDPYHGFRLSGTADTNPLDAVLTILHQPNRPAFSLPALLVALFLARAAHPDTLAHRQLFRWIASAIPHLRRHLAAGSIQAGWNDERADSAEQGLSTLIGSGLI